jgi:hypothetical protein
MKVEVRVFRSLSRQLALELEAHGFRRHAFRRPTTFARREGDVTQLATWGRSGELFDLFLGVYIPEFGLVQEGKIDSDPCWVHLGFHLSAVADAAPVVLKDQARFLLDPSVPEIVERALRERALPLLMHMSSRSWLVDNLDRHVPAWRPLSPREQKNERGAAVLPSPSGSDQLPVHFMLTPRHICEAILRAGRGEKELAERVLRDTYSLAARHHPQHAAHLVLVASRLGLSFRPADEGDGGLT